MPYSNIVVVGAVVKNEYHDITTYHQKMLMLLKMLNENILVLPEPEQFDYFHHHNRVYTEPVIKH